MLSVSSAAEAAGARSAGGGTAGEDTPPAGARSARARFRRHNQPPTIADTAASAKLATIAGRAQSNPFDFTVAAGFGWSPNCCLRFAARAFLSIAWWWFGTIAST
jgi:hypothetical protein